MIVLTSLPDSDTIVVIPIITKYIEVQNSSTILTPSDTELIQRVYHAIHDTIATIHIKS